MVMKRRALALLAALLSLSNWTAVSAHPDQHQPQAQSQAQHRQLAAAHTKRALAECSVSHHARKLQEQAATRRTAKLEQIRRDRNANGAADSRKLGSSAVLAKSHKSSLTGLSVAESSKIDSETLFGSEPKCVLEPEVTLGPYYVSGELLRSDIRETQAGIDLYTELQIIDVNTCKPVEDLFLDFWHCNATGVYSGIVAGGNGNSADASNLNATFNRGVASTGADGVVTFLTTFPGHYAGRAVHIHVLGTHNGTLLENNTYTGGSAAHVGQIFFDQDLVESVKKTPVYARNTQQLTTNAGDGIFAQAAASGFDPVVEYVLLGDKVEDGVFAWISIGVNMTLANGVTGAATWTKDGGVANANSSNGFGGPGGKGERGGNGPPPVGTSQAPAISADSTTAAKKPSFAGRNLAILFLLVLGFLVSPYNRWIPVPCRIGGEGGDVATASKYAQISRT